MDEQCSCCARELKEFPLLSYNELMSLTWETIQEDCSIAIRSLTVSLHCIYVPPPPPTHTHTKLRAIRGLRITL